MKTNRYTLLFVLAATCSAAHAQDAFRNLALVEATSAPATTAPTAGGDFFSQPVSTSAATAATTVAAPTPKDVQTAPVAKTLIGGDGETSRPAYEGRSSRPSSAPAPATSGKDGVPAPVAYEEGDSVTDLSFMLELGYASKYFYHGLDQVDAASRFNDTSGVLLGGVSATWQGFFLGYKYAYATDDTIPRESQLGTENYSEHIFEGGYTIGILPQGWLDLTASYQHIIFGEDGFWGNDAQGRIMIKAEMNRYQWFRPSVAFYKFDGLSEKTTARTVNLDGEQIIFQIQGGGQVYEYGPVAFGVSYYVLAGLDDEYNGSNNFSEMNYYQAGLSFPIIYQNLTIAPSVHWCQNVESDPTNDEMWVGINATYRF